MYEHTFFIGMNDKDTLKQELSFEQYKKHIHDTVGDCTIQGGGVGIFTNADNVTTEENSLQVKVFTEKRDTTRMVNCAKKLKQLLNQESIILETKKSNSKFI